MSYQAIVEMASSQSLLARITAAAAKEGITEPLQWAQQNVWKLASSPGWAEDWEYATSTATDDVNPDTGIRPAVIDDSQILASVQALWAEQNPA